MADHEERPEQTDTTANEPSPMTPGRPTNPQGPTELPTQTQRETTTDRGVHFTSPIVPARRESYDAERAQADTEDTNPIGSFVTTREPTPSTEEVAQAVRLLRRVVEILPSLGNETGSSDGSTLGTLSSASGYSITSFRRYGAEETEVLLQESYLEQVRRLFGEITFEVKVRGDPLQDFSHNNTARDTVAQPDGAQENPVQEHATQENTVQENATDENTAQVATAQNDANLQNAPRDNAARNNTRDNARGHTQGTAQEIAAQGAASQEITPQETTQQITAQETTAQETTPQETTQETTARETAHQETTQDATPQETTQEIAAQETAPQETTAQETTQETTAQETAPQETTHQEPAQENTARQNMTNNQIDQTEFVQNDFVQINLSALYRADLHRHQFRLAEEAISYSTDATRAENLDSTLLHNYIQALKDWRYVQETVSFEGNDPFRINPNDEAGRNIIRKLHELMSNDVYRHPNTKNELDRLMRAMDNIAIRPAREQDTRTVFGISRNERHNAAIVRSYLRRLFMAIVGGAFLICPVTIMAYHQALWITLLTTSLFVLALGVFLAAWIDNEFNVLAGAAAYTAVLVVFVGLSAEKS